MAPLTVVGGSVEGDAADKDDSVTVPSHRHRTVRNRSRRVRGPCGLICRLNTSLGVSSVGKRLALRLAHLCISRDGGIVSDLLRMVRTITHQIRHLCPILTCNRKTLRRWPRIQHAPSYTQRLRLYHGVRLALRHKRRHRACNERRKRIDVSHIVPMPIFGLRVGTSEMRELRV